MMCISIGRTVSVLFTSAQQSCNLQHTFESIAFEKIDSRPAAGSDVCISYDMEANGRFKRLALTAQMMTRPALEAATHHAGQCKQQKCRGKLLWLNCTQVKSYKYLEERQ